MPIYISVYIAAVVGYGWALESGVTIAVPLIMQFISKNAPTCLRHRYLTPYMQWATPS
jgi:hypothetical protein